MHPVENVREKVGVFVAAIAVICFIISGPVSMAATIWSGNPIGFPEDWKSAMLSLASAAFGYLVGKQTSGNPAAVNGVTVPIADPGSTQVNVTTKDAPAKDAPIKPAV